MSNLLEVLILMDGFLSVLIDELVIGISEKEIVMLCMAREELVWFSWMNKW